MCSLIRFETVNDESNRKSLVRKQFAYVTKRMKMEKAVLREKFLEKCVDNKLIPRFLQKFNFPKIDAYDSEKIERFQRKILKDELEKAKKLVLEKQELVKESADIFWKAIPPDITKEEVHIKIENMIASEVDKLGLTHQRKLIHLSEQQGKPLRETNKKAYNLVDLEDTPPDFVLNVLSKGPRHPVRVKFDKLDFLAEMDMLIEHVECFTGPSENIINEINIKACQYVKKMECIREDMELSRMRKWLKQHQIKAVPYDKGVGFALMSQKGYDDRIDNIISGEQFERKKLRANSRPIELVEQDRINNVLDDLYKKGKISKATLNTLKIRGGQIPKIYGLAKVHKEGVPLRPIVSMSGSVYEKIGKLVSEWISRVPESRINCGSKTVTDVLRKGRHRTKIRSNRKLVSFDVVSLYTNVPVKEAICLAAEKLYELEDAPPVDKETFITLAQLCCSDVLLRNNNGVYIQKHGLAMGIQPAPGLTNIWLSKFDDIIKGDGEIYFRYMDDILTDVLEGEERKKLGEINGLHPQLRFTVEVLNNDSQNEDELGRIPFLDMEIIQKNDGNLESDWFTKPSDTGIIMNWYAIAPLRYKKNIVSGFVNRIWSATTNYEAFVRGCEKAKVILTNNQYPKNWVEWQFGKVIEKVHYKRSHPKDGLDERGKKLVPMTENDTEARMKRLVFLQYGGIETERLAEKLVDIGCVMRPVFTLRKMKTVTPTLKPRTELFNQSNLIYHYECASCKEAYIGYTTRHLGVRVEEHHTRKSTAIYRHHQICAGTFDKNGFTILHKSNKSRVFLEAVEALFIHYKKPKINDKDEFRSRQLRLKLF